MQELSLKQIPNSLKIMKLKPTTSRIIGIGTTPSVNQKILEFSDFINQTNICR